MRVSKYKLGELFKITSGGTPSRANKDNYENGTIPWVKTGDLKNQYIFSVDEYITEKALATSSAKLFPENTVLLAMYGATIGNCSIMRFSGATNQACAAFIPSSKVDANFLYYFLYSIKSKLISMGVGGAQPNISIGILKEIDIELPLMEEQKTIVKILDKAQTLINKRKEALAKLDELVQALFFDIFGDPIENQHGWPMKPFSYFAKIDTTMTTDFEYYSEYPHIGIENIEKDTGELINYKLVKEQQLSSGKYIFNEKHIIYSKIRPYLNKVATPEFYGLCSADSYPILVENSKTNRTFFAYMLRSQRFLNHVESLSTRTNIPKVNKSQLESFECPCPPLDLQNDFSNKVTIILNYKRQMNVQLQQLEFNFQALLQKAFKGELKVKDGVAV